MKRLLVPVAACLLALGLAGCAAGDETVVRVDGEGILTRDELDDQLADIADDADFVTTYEARGAGRETLSSGFVASVLSNHVLNDLLVTALADEGVEVTAADRAAGEEQLSAATGGPVDDLPAGYRDLLVDLFTHATALQGLLGGDQVALQERVTELLDEADVEIAARYGSWDPEAGSVVPPEGPLSPATTVPLVLTG